MEVYCLSWAEYAFVALCNNEEFQDLDFSSLKITASGGMALTSDTAKMWKTVTGCDAAEGYGMTETSPVCDTESNERDSNRDHRYPNPSTLLKTINDEGVKICLKVSRESCVSKVLR